MAIPVIGEFLSPSIQFFVTEEGGNLGLLRRHLPSLVFVSATHARLVSVIVAAAEWEATGVKFSAHSWELRDRSLFGLMGTTSIAILVSFVDMN